MLFCEKGRLAHLFVTVRALSRSCPGQESQLHPSWLIVLFLKVLRKERLAIALEATDLTGNKAVIYDSPFPIIPSDA